MVVMATPGAPTAVAATPSTGVSANSGGRPPGRTPVHQISASLPSLFRTAPQPSNRRRSHQVPAAAASSPLAAADRRDAMNLVSTQCQTEDVLPHNVRAENARNAHDAAKTAIRAQTSWRILQLPYTKPNRSHPAENKHSESDPSGVCHHSRSDSRSVMTTA